MKIYTSGNPIRLDDDFYHRIKAINYKHVFQVVIDVTLYIKF